MEYKEVLDYWFGPNAIAFLPSVERTHLWFAEDDSNDEEIKQRFLGWVEKARNNQLNHWAEEAEGRLALILLLDNFSRRVYRSQPLAYYQDFQALNLCEEGIAKEHDQRLTLTERVFFYMPLQHAEDLIAQENSVTMYKSLYEIALPETKVVFSGFLEYAMRHYEIIKKFGRFPQRNTILSRVSSPDEMQYLQQLEN